MRTTLTIEEDVAARLKEHMTKTGKSMKDSVNDLIRLAMQLERKHPREPFTVKPFATGPLPGLSFDNIEDLLDQVEGSDRKW